MIERGQYERLVRLLPELYSAQTLETLPKHLVALLPQLIRAENYSYNETNFALRRFALVAHPTLGARGPPEAAETLARLMHHHPMVLLNPNSEQPALTMVA